MTHTTDTLERSSTGNGADPSVTSALERLAGASQGVITKRIDLALLEGQQIVAQIARSAAFGLLGALLACASWFTLIACAILLYLPDARTAIHLAVFGAVNGVAAAILLFLATQRSGSEARAPIHSTNGVASTGRIIGQKESGRE